MLPPSFLFENKDQNVCSNESWEWTQFKSTKPVGVGDLHFKLMFFLSNIFLFQQSEEWGSCQKLFDVHIRFHIRKDKSFYLFFQSGYFHPVRSGKYLWQNPPLVIVKRRLSKTSALLYVRNTCQKTCLCPFGASKKQGEKRLTRKRVSLSCTFKT